MFARRVGAIALLLLGSACSSNPEPEMGATASAQNKNGDVITADELADPSVSAGDAYDAVKRLRPRFLMTRGAMSAKNVTAGSVHISVDGGPLLTVENLRNLRPSQIAEIRYLSSSDAAQRFGTNAASGAVIMVKSR